MVLLKNQVPITVVLVFIVCLQCFGSCDEDKKELLPETGLELKHETLQNYQGDQPTSGESFVAVPVSGVGTKEELNPKLVGLINISKLYLPQEYEFKEIISATREIVAGVRYTIQVKARDDNKLETECQLVILEKPWLHNNWGDKIRELEKSNCTSSSGALNIDGLQTGVTDGEYKFGTMFNPNPLFINSGGLTPEKVTHVDAQVMTFNYKTDNTPEVVTRVPDSAFSDCTDNVPVVVTPPPYVVDVSQITYYNSDTPLTSDNDQNVIAKRHETETANKEEDIVAEGSETVTEKVVINESNNQTQRRRLKSIGNRQSRRKLAHRDSQASNQSSSTDNNPKNIPARLQKTSTTKMLPSSSTTEDDDDLTENYPKNFPTKLPLTSTKEDSDKRSTVSKPRSRGTRKHFLSRTTSTSTTVPEQTQSTTENHPPSTRRSFSRTTTTSTTVPEQTQSTTENHPPSTRRSFSRNNRQKTTLNPSTSANTYKTRSPPYYTHRRRTSFATHSPKNSITSRSTELTTNSPSTTLSTTQIPSSTESTTNTPSSTETSTVVPSSFKPASEVPILKHRKRLFSSRYRTITTEEQTESTTTVSVKSTEPPQIQETSTESTTKSTTESTTAVSIKSTETPQIQETSTATPTHRRIPFTRRRTTTADIPTTAKPHARDEDVARRRQRIPSHRRRTTTQPTVVEEIKTSISQFNDLGSIKSSTTVTPSTSETIRHRPVYARRKTTPATVSTTDATTTFISTMNIPITSSRGKASYASSISAISDESVEKTTEIIRHKPKYTSRTTTETLSTVESSTTTVTTTTTEVTSTSVSSTKEPASSPSSSTLPSIITTVKDTREQTDQTTKMLPNTPSIPVTSSVEPSSITVEDQSETPLEFSTRFSSHRRPAPRRYSPTTASIDITVTTTEITPLYTRPHNRETPSTSPVTTDTDDRTVNENTISILEESSTIRNTELTTEPLVTTSIAATNTRRRQRPTTTTVNPTDVELITEIQPKVSEIIVSTLPPQIPTEGQSSPSTTQSTTINTILEDSSTVKNTELTTELLVTTSIAPRNTRRRQRPTTTIVNPTDVEIITEIQPKVSEIIVSTSPPQIPTESQSPSSTTQSTTIITEAQIITDTQSKVSEISSSTLSTQISIEPIQTSPSTTPSTTTTLHTQTIKNTTPYPETIPVVVVQETLPPSPVTNPPTTTIPPTQPPTTSENPAHSILIIKADPLIAQALLRRQQLYPPPTQTTQQPTTVSQEMYQQELIEQILNQIPQELQQQLDEDSLNAIIQQAQGFGQPISQIQFKPDVEISNQHEQSIEQRPSPVTTEPHIVFTEPVTTQAPTSTEIPTQPSQQTGLSISQHILQQIIPRVNQARDSQHDDVHSETPSTNPPQHTTQPQPIQQPILSREQPRPVAPQQSSHQIQQQIQQPVNPQPAQQPIIPPQPQQPIVPPPPQQPIIPPQSHPQGFHPQNIPSSEQTNLISQQINHLSELRQQLIQQQLIQQQLIQQQLLQRQNEINIPSKSVRPQQPDPQVVPIPQQQQPAPLPPPPPPKPSNIPIETNNVILNNVQNQQRSFANQIQNHVHEINAVKQQLTYSKPSTSQNTAQVPTSVAPERINIPINVPQKPKHIIQSVDASLNFLDEKEPEPTVNEIPDTSNNKVPSSQTLFFSVSDPEDEEVEEYDDMDFINQADVRHITKEEVEQAILQFYSESEKKRNNENIKRSLGSSPLTSVNELDIDDSLKEYLRDALTSPEERSSATIKRESKENFNEPDNEKIDSIPKHVFLFTDDNPSDDQDNEELPLISEASIRTEIISEPVFDKQIVNIEIPADSLGDVPTLGGIESTGHTEVAPYTDDLISHFSLNVLPIGGLSSIQVGSITNVTKQVVAGISYKGTILYLVKPTDYTQKMYTVTCDFNIWIRSWLEPPMDKIISETCDTSNLNQLRQRRGVAGGVTSIKPSELSGFTNLLLDAALKGDVAKSKVEIVSITNTTKQVVAGMLYTGIVTYRVLDDDQSQTLSCNFKIWDRPWLKIGEKVSLTCDGKELVAFEDNNTRRKRSLLYDRRNPNYVNEEELRLQSMFNKFVVDYGKSYANVLERAARYRIFKSNLVLIDQLNRNELGTAEYGITEFADLTTAEYKLRTGLVPRPNGESNDISKLPAEIPDNVDLPKSFDWREKNAVTPVKNQGSCGSCWAFSVTGNIEGLNAIKTGKLDEFSEQELLDCDTVDSACNGGLPDNAYQAIEKIGGLEYESEYPYKAKKDTCKFSSDKARVKLSSSVDLPKNETAMALWLIQNGPISIGINANAMQFYRGGVSHPWKVLCLPSKIDHGVLIVGYGVVENVVFNKTMPYWIVKNSWGTTWGEQGYYRIFRGTNACGVSEMASSAILA